MVSKTDDFMTCLDWIDINIEEGQYFGENRVLECHAHLQDDHVLCNNSPMEKARHVADFTIGNGEMFFYFFYRKLKRI